MSPPTFADLGKSARDLFSKGYNAGLIKLDSTTRAGEKNEVEFKLNSAHNITAAKMSGGLDIKYKMPQYGVTLTEKWNTENQLGTTVEVNEQFGRGLKVTLDSMYSPSAGKRSGKLKADWSLPTARLNAEIGLTGTPIISTSAVFQKDTLLLGASAVFDTASNKLTSSQIALGQSTPDYTLNSFVLNAGEIGKAGTEFGADLYHKISRQVEIGALVRWKTGGNAAVFSVATKYSPSRDMTLRAKLSNDSQAAVSATHTLSPAVKLILTSQFTLAANEAHKFGLGLEFDPSN